MNYLRIATAQFPVSEDTRKNFEFIKIQIIDASGHEADIIHFPETALPGYLNIPKDDSSSRFSWNTLESYLKLICVLALKYKIWVIVGTVRKTDDPLPRNSVCIISSSGEIVGHYDKQRLYKSEASYYSVGQTPLVVSVNGYKCGFLICYDNCFPELYTIYRKLGVGLIFHSFHNAGNKTETSIKNLMAANLIIRSADNLMWISASNSSTSYSPLQATIARPDGSANKVKRHETGIVVVDYPKAELGWTYDNTKV